MDDFECTDVMNVMGRIPWYDRKALEDVGLVRYLVLFKYKGRRGHQFAEVNRRLIMDDSFDLHGHLSKQAERWAKRNYEQG